MKKRLCLLLLIVLPLFGFTGYSQTLSEQGISFLNAKFGQSGILPDDFKFTNNFNQGKLQVFESYEPPCFVIFRETRENHEVVAYSTKNSFTLEDSVNNTASAILGAIENTPPRKIIKSSDIVIDKPLSPMIQSKWNQDDWYNRLCPYEPDCRAGENVYVGCIAVAMGQIINYYGKWNDFLIDAEHSYKGQSLKAYATSYSWGEMLNTPLSYDLEVSKILADLGILVKMSYGPQSSSQGSGWARKAFNDLGYENAYKADKHNFSDEEWLELIYSNIQAYLPVLISGGGHAYICDGYDEDGLLHFNLGWGGYGDGYYNHNSVFNKYVASEAILDLEPGNSLGKPAFIGINYIGNEQIICWTPPVDELPLFYRLYFNDEDYIELNDTIIALNEIPAGKNELMVSAVYNEGESLWIGPARVYNSGEKINVSDEALLKAIRVSVSQNEKFKTGRSFTYGDLASIKSLKIEDEIISTGLLSQMKGIQELEINGSKLTDGDFQFLDNLEMIQKFGISNFHTNNLPSLAGLKKLVHLKLDSCTIGDLSYLADLDHLIVLEINNCEVGDFTLPAELDNLQQLIINGTRLPSGLNIAQDSDLRRLTISGCGLEELDFKSDYSHLSYLDLSNNGLDQLDFLAGLKNLKKLKLNNNELETLDIHSDHPLLAEIDIRNNSINKVSFSFDFMLMEKLDLSFNELTEFPGIFKNMPNLQELSVSHNKIEELPLLRLLYLRELDISHNKLKHLDGIELYEALKKLHLNNNAISDFRPMTEQDHYMNLLLLNIDNNPVSKESYQEILPELKREINVVLSPDTYEGRSPCFPLPVPGEKVSNYSLEFRWECESPSGEGSYDFHFGTGDSIKVINYDLKNPFTSVRLAEGQKYKWQVEAHYQDTSFFSGLYEISTTSEIDIPYKEEFEHFSLGQGITKESSNWRLTHGSSDTYQDAEISNSKSYTGTGKSLHINSFSNITLDLDHITDVATLVIQFDLFVIKGKSSHVNFKNINGLQIDLYTNGNNSQVFINGIANDVFEVNPDAWNCIRLSIQGINERVSLRCNNKTVFNKKWLFKNERAHIDGIVFSSTTLGNGFNFIDFESYIDNLNIYDANNRTEIEETEIGSDEITISPNPTNKNILLGNLPHDKQDISIEFINSRGQKIYQEQLYGYNTEVLLPVSHLSPGVYFYHVTADSSSLKKGKILIAR